MKRSGRESACRLEAPSTGRTTRREAAAQFTFGALEEDLLDAFMAYGPLAERVPRVGESRRVCFVEFFCKGRGRARRPRRPVNLR